MKFTMSFLTSHAILSDKCMNLFSCSILKSSTKRILTKYKMEIYGPTNLYESHAIFYSVSFLFHYFLNFFCFPFLRTSIFLLYQAFIILFRFCLPHIPLSITFMLAYSQNLHIQFILFSTAAVRECK